jgi:hypothetical protein
MRRSLIVFTFAIVGGISATAQIPAAEISATAPASTFLPAIGQSEQYRYLDTVTARRTSARVSGTLTLTSVTAKKVQATITVDGNEPRSVDFYVDDTGALLPMSIPEPITKSGNKRHSSDQEQRAIAAQALLIRLSLASRIGARPGEGISFPVKFNVDGASCPLNPTLVVKTVEQETLIGDAKDKTSINPPRANQKVFMPLGLGIGAGFIGGAIGGTPGRIAGISISATSFVVGIVRARHSRPLPADVNLHIDGKLADGRLLTLSGDQEVIMHSGKHTRTISEKWSIVTETGASARL